MEDQLRDLAGLRMRPMFGGHGLYQGPAFFGILFKGRLYFKTTPATRPGFVARGMRPFRPNARQTLRTYYEVPVAVLEDPEQLAAWAREAAGRPRATGGSRR